MKILILLLLLFASMQLHAQSSSATLNNYVPTAFSSIRQEDLHDDLYTLASDAMRGRRAVTSDELNGAAWIAEQARKAGLQPAGDNGTYFQFFPIERSVVDDKTNIDINGKSLVIWQDVWVVEPVDATLDSDIKWLSSLADTSKPGISGSVVAMKIFPPFQMPPSWVSLWGLRYVFAALRSQAGIVKAQGAKALILVADSTTDAALKSMEHELDFETGSYELENDHGYSLNLGLPVMLVHEKEATSLQQPGAHIKADIRSDHFTYPSVNVVAKVRGTDAKLTNEYLLYSGHHDHEGVGQAIAGDSIWNGADDNGSVCVAMLAIGRAFVKHPARRPVLFVWHGAEERGLMGSRWYAAHPTVKKEDIIAVINGDMIGRNNPDSAALLGVTRPHRNSKDLADAAFKANQIAGHFKIDTTWDSPKHPEFWYYRSDHLSYAAVGIPSIFFSTLLHPDYHTPKDEPNGIDYSKLKRMTDWMYATGWLVANAPKRPAMDNDSR
ncbi:MAG: M28 family peptidase [Ginsengibacter sp.]